MTRRTKVEIILMIIIVLFFTGYAGMHTQAAGKEDKCFTLSYRDTDIVISFEDCTCEYDSGDLKIYTKYIDDGPTAKEDRYFPRFSQVAYLWTPDDSRQIFPVYDYCIDKKSGSAYFLFRGGNGEFIGLYQYTVRKNVDSGKVTIAGEKVLSACQVRDWLAEAGELPADGGQTDFSDVQVILGALEYEQGKDLLKGEVSGICGTAGKRYYASWEIAPATGEENITPHARKIYTEETDKEVFDACDRAFDRIEQGGCSGLVPCAGQNSWLGGTDWKWCRMDVNGDGLPELIDVRGDIEGPIFPIEHIFAYIGGITNTVELVYVDLNDYTEYLYLGSNGNLIYDYSDFGIICCGQYNQYQFDENWGKELLGKLVVYYFDKEGYSEEEIEHLKEDYPDTYGKRGGGYYYFQSRPGADGELVQKELTQKAFLEAYLEMTGFDFITENRMDFPDLD